MEALQNRAELLLLKCRKELRFGHLDELKKKCNKERDDVLRMEGSLFAKLRRDHEDRLAEEKQEAARVQLELELAEKELAELERQIFVLENVSSIYNVEELHDVEKELHDWCEMMEKGWLAFSSLHKWMAEAETERLRLYSNLAKAEKNVQMHDALDAIFLQLDDFLSMIGRVRYLPGVRVNTGFRTNRTQAMGGKTLMFFRKGYGAFQVDLHECYLREMESGWATGEALGRKLKEIEHLEKLCRSIIIEKLPQGEELLRKVRVNRFQPAKKDIFGFEKEL
ncbi:MAG: hypothetical protein IJN89_09025 [Anaerotignum sp.]|nr:hypothetical protein [Anaerotignum sp.]